MAQSRLADCKKRKIMTEDLNVNSEVPEVAPQVETNVNEVNDVANARQEADERNWKAMRIKNNDLEKRLKQYEEMQMQIMQAQLANSKPVHQEIDEYDSIADDEFIPKGKVKGLVQREAQKIAKQFAKEEVEAFHKKQSDSQFMDRLMRQYSDFNEIVNPETLSLLEEREPELAKTISESKDPYKIGEEVPGTRRKKEIEKAIDKSEKNIPSPASFDKRPMAQAFKMTDAQKKELYREMHGYAAMASSVPEMG
jgi:hypothetical protein